MWGFTTIRFGERPSSIRSHKNQRIEQSKVVLKVSYYQVRGVVKLALEVPHHVHLLSKSSHQYIRYVSN